jgi:hypothetical protein
MQGLEPMHTTVRSQAAIKYLLIFQRTDTKKGQSRASSIASANLKHKLTLFLSIKLDVEIT